MKCLTTFVAAAGIPLSNEVHFDGRERPADVFIDRWTTPDPEAVDVTVTHPLADLFLTRGRGGTPPDPLVPKATCGKSAGGVAPRSWKATFGRHSSGRGRRIGGAGR